MMLKIIEKKKYEATAEREEKMNSSMILYIFIDWLKQEITNSLNAIHGFIQYEINKYVDRAYFLTCCPYFLKDKPIPTLFDEIVLEFDNSLIGEEPYSLIDKLPNEGKRLVSVTSKN